MWNMMQAFLQTPSLLLTKFRTKMDIISRYIIKNTEHQRAVITINESMCFDFKSNLPNCPRVSGWASLLSVISWPSVAQPRLHLARPRSVTRTGSLHPPVLGADHAGVVGVVVQSPLVQQPAVKISFAALHLLIYVCKINMFEQCPQFSIIAIHTSYMKWLWSIFERNMK